MRLLALDTSSSAVTAAVHDGSNLLGEVTETGAQAHGELLAPVLQRVLVEAGVAVGDLTHIAVGVGPGPFTGLRVGIVTARVMGDALAIPVHGVCSLDSLAFQAVSEGTVTTAFSVASDARRREVYAAAYDVRGARVGGPEVLRAAELPATVHAGPVVGAGAWLYPAAFTDPREPRLPSAAWLAGFAVAALRTGVGLLPPDPLYLRRPDAVESASRKRVTQA
jgi:tRNA threonylcarbamoyl adenosine modification protein YeaZ